MPRANRAFHPGAYYHVVNRGNRKNDIFRSDDDRRTFLARMADSFGGSGIRCLAYCLMDNHYHAVVRTDQPDLATPMQWLEARYAEYFNLKHSLTGHSFQGRYRADPIDSDAYLLAAIRYVLLNPVRAGICTNASECQWTSYAATVGARRHTDWFDRTATLALFGTDVDLAVAAFTRFLAAGVLTGWLANTPKRRERREQDRAIHNAHATGNYSLRTLGAMFGVSATSVMRALQRYAKGSDPSA